MSLIRYITYEEAKKRYSMSAKQINRLAMEADALGKKIGRVVLINCDIFENYLMQFKSG